MARPSVVKRAADYLLAARQVRPVRFRFEDPFGGHSRVPSAVISKDKVLAAKPFIVVIPCA